MTTIRGNGRVLLAAAAVVAALAGGSTVAIAAATGAFDDNGTHRATTCATPSLSGTVVAATLVDMGPMRGGGGMMQNGQGGQSGQGRWRTWRPGMMRVTATPETVPHGTVSLRVTNQGVITHELVILPLPSGQNVGSRPVGSAGTVDEAGSLGEVSAPCAPGTGGGLTPGSTGWTTLTLPAGRYELICNLPGHYGAGMYAELDVT